MKTVLDDLDAIEARANAATSGPWVWADYSQMKPGGDLLLSGFRQNEDDEYMEAIIQTDGGHYGPEEKDAAFIAAARTDVPALVAEVRRLRGAVSHLLCCRECGEVANGCDEYHARFGDNA